VRALPASSLRSWNGLRHISYGPLQAPLLKFCCRLHCANNVCALPGEQERSVASHLVSKRLTRPRRQGSLRSWREQSAVRALGSMGNSKRPTLKRREWTRNHTLGPHAYLAERCVPRAGNYLTLTFSKPSDDGGGIASYKVEVSLVEDFDVTKTPQVLRSPRVCPGAVERWRGCDLLSSRRTH